MIEQWRITMLRYDSVLSWICIYGAPVQLVCDWHFRELGGQYIVELSR